MIRVLVVDDHAVVRRGVVEILADSPDVRVLGEAGTGREALQRVHTEEYDVILLDIALPDGSGLDVLKQLRLLKPNMVVLVLSMYPETQYAVRALRAGASGYLTKDSVAEELLMAIHKVCRGGYYVTAALAERLAKRLNVESEEPHETLSDREDQVMRLLATGKRVGEIAEQLALSAKTVSTYRARILKKLGLESTVEIVRYALEHKLVPLNTPPCDARSPDSPSLRVSVSEKHG